MDFGHKDKSHLLQKNRNGLLLSEKEKVCHEVAYSHLIGENPTVSVPHFIGTGSFVNGGYMFIKTQCEVSGDTPELENGTNKNIKTKDLSDIEEQPAFSKGKKSPLSNEFKVAVEIYRCEENGKRVWYTKLKSLLKSEMAPNTISKSLDVLLDWGIVKSEFGETENDRPGKLLKITNDSKATIRDLYNKYWKEYRYE